MAAPPTRLDGRGRCVHEYIACDGCDVNPIVGFRYNSVHEPNKDYCESCFRKLARGKRDVFYRVSHVHGFERLGPSPVATGRGMELALQPLRRESPTVQSIERYFTKSVVDGSKQLKLLQVWQVNNSNLYRLFRARRNDGIKPLMDRTRSLLPVPPHSQDLHNLLAAASNEYRRSPELNELLLFHGCSAEALGKILERGFETRISKTSGWFGMGTYFAANSCKSDDFTQAAGSTRTMLLCKVVLGTVYTATSTMRGTRLPPARPGGKPHDSVFAPATCSGISRCEYIVYHDNQAYPQYVIKYKVA